VKTIPLSLGYEARIDDRYYALLKRIRWNVIETKHTQYAVWYRTSREKVLMHRMLLGAEPGVVVDHLDGDGLNNQVSNLRICDRSQNVMHARRHRPGASRYKGVDMRKGKWRARIGSYGQRFSLGDYDTEIEAALAYDWAALWYHGEFAVLNLWDKTEIACVSATLVQRWA
jgi:hypothetical protein